MATVGFGLLPNRRQGTRINAQQGSRNCRPPPGHREGGPEEKSWCRQKSIRQVKNGQVGAAGIVSLAVVVVAGSGRRTVPASRSPVHVSEYEVPPMCHVVFHRLLAGGLRHSPAVSAAVVVVNSYTATSP